MSRYSNGSRAVTPTTCRDCGADVLVGLDADMCALTVTVDPPTDLDPLHEAVAVLAGCDTYSVHGRELHHRDYPSLPTERARPIAVTHRCPEQPTAERLF